MRLLDYFFNYFFCFLFVAMASNFMVASSIDQNPPFGVLDGSKFLGRPDLIVSPVKVSNLINLNDENFSQVMDLVVSDLLDDGGRRSEIAKILLSCNMFFVENSDENHLLNGRVCNLSLLKKDAMGNGAFRDVLPSTLGVTVSIEKNLPINIFIIEGLVSYESLKRVVLHEGSHLSDYLDKYKGGVVFSNLELEERAFELHALLLEEQLIQKGIIMGDTTSSYIYENMDEIISKMSRDESEDGFLLMELNMLINLKEGRLKDYLQDIKYP